MTQSFLQSLQTLLDSLPGISSVEVSRAIALIKDSHKQKIKAMSLAEGSCFHCRQPMTYKQPLCQVHIELGNEWTKMQIEAWENPAKIVLEEGLFNNPMINGLSMAEASRYICDKCFREEITPTTCKIADELHAKYIKAEEEKEQYISDVLRGKRRTTPYNAYWLLRENIEQFDQDELADMPYKDFLKSQYWKIVRDYVVYKQDSKCQLCSSANNLHVHHRTYEHRGSEIWHLDDLIVLCRNCHAKHHDKLGAIAVPSARYRAIASKSVPITKRGQIGDS